MTDVFSIAQGNGFYNPPCAVEKVAYEDLAALISPKSIASPCVAKVK